MKNKKYGLIVWCIIVMLLITACGSAEKADKKVNQEDSYQAQENKSQSTTLKNDTGKKEKVAKGQDIEIGLSSMKMGQIDDLTPEQELIIQYFDNDYFSVNDYEFMQRYPQIFKGAQIHTVGEITKIISATDEDYQALVSIFDIMSEIASYEQGDDEAYLKNQIVVNGKQPNGMRVIEGDIVQMYGRYVSIDDYTIDGVSYNVPTFNLYDTSYLNDRSRFEPDFIKKVATTIFGKNIEVRNAVAGEDYTGDGLSWKFGYDPYMICELENQTNSKFTKFRFYTERGMIDDAKGASSEPELDTFTTNIIRKIEFAPDFQHYLLFTYDIDLNTLSLDYYDTEFNKLWNREFENTTNAVYDYTSTAVYLVANNDLYMISLEDGEDKCAPIYVGEKTRVCKVEDGIILIANSKNDTVMKVSLSGEMAWKTNTSQEPENIDVIQLIDGRILISSSSGWSFIIVNDSDGALISEITGE